MCVAWVKVIIYIILVPDDTVHKGTKAFPYLGRTITFNNNNWEEVYLNLHKYRRRWGVIARVMYRKGATVRARVAMYKSVAQSVLLYGRNRWVVTGDIIKVLTEFHHRAAQRITGMKAKRGTG